MRGTLSVVDDPVRVRGIVDRLTDKHEASRPVPWKTTDAPTTFIASQLAAIVGVELSVNSIEGKLKLSQNRNEADQAGVVAGLNSQGDAAAEAVADMMETRLRDNT